MDKFREMKMMRKLAREKALKANLLHGIPKSKSWGGKKDIRLERKQLKNRYKNGE